MQRVTGVTNAAGVHPPRLDLVGFGVGREDGRLQPRPVQLACSGTYYLCFQQINWIGPKYCAVWPNHVRLVANHMAFWFHTWFSEYSHYSVISVPDISTVDTTGTTEAPQSPRDRGM